jgi:hypothetical protein
MAENRVRIIIEADAKQAQQVIGQLGAQVSEVGKKSSGKGDQSPFRDLAQGAKEVQASIGGVKGSLEQLRSIGGSVGSVLGMGAGLAGGAMVAANAFRTLHDAMEFVKASTMEAARYETLGTVITTVGRNAGYSGQEMEAFAKTLQATGISMTGSREALARMSEAHLDFAQSAKLARVAQDAAVIGNMNSTEAFQHLVEGIATGEVRMLRHVGIVANFEASYAKMAAQLGVSTNSLDEYQKARARTNAVEEAAAAISGTYEAAMETAGKQMKSMERYMDDLKVKVGEALQPALKEVVTDWTATVKALGDVAESPGGKKFLEWLGDAASLASKLASAATAIGGKMAEVAGDAGVRREAEIYSQIPASDAHAGVVERPAIWTPPNGNHYSIPRENLSDKQLDPSDSILGMPLDDFLNAPSQEDLNYRMAWAKERAHRRELTQQQRDEEDRQRAQREEREARQSYASTVQEVINKNQDVYQQAEALKGSLPPELQREHAFKEYWGSYQHAQDAINGGKWAGNDTMVKAGQELHLSAARKYEEQLRAIDLAATASADGMKKFVDSMRGATDIERMALEGGSQYALAMTRTTKQYQQDLDDLTERLKAYKDDGKEAWGAQARAAIEARRAISELHAAQDRYFESMKFHASAMRELGELTGSPSLRIAGEFTNMNVQEARLKAQFAQEKEVRLAHGEDAEAVERDYWDKITEVDRLGAAKRQEVILRAFGDSSWLLGAFNRQREMILRQHRDLVAFGADPKLAAGDTQLKLDEVNRQELAHRMALETNFGSFLADRLSMEYGLYQSSLAKRQALYEEFFESLKSGIEGVENALGKGLDTMLGDMGENKLKRFRIYFKSFEEDLRKDFVGDITSVFKTGLKNFGVKPLLEGLAGGSGSGQGGSGNASAQDIAAAIMGMVGGGGQPQQGQRQGLQESNLSEPRIANGSRRGGGSPVSSGVAKWADLASYWERYNGLPGGTLSALMQEESGGDPNARNPKSGATGLLQVLPANFRMFGGEDPTNPSANLRVGSRIAGDFYRQSGGDMDAMLKGFGGFVKADPSEYIRKFWSHMPIQGTGDDGGYGLLGRQGVQAVSSATSSYGVLGLMGGNLGAPSLLAKIPTSGGVTSIFTGENVTEEGGGASLTPITFSTMGGSGVGLTGDGSSTDVSNAMVANLVSQGMSPEAATAYVMSVMGSGGSSSALSGGSLPAQASKSSSGSLSLSSLAQDAGYAKQGYDLISGNGGITGAINDWGYNTLGIGTQVPTNWVLDSGQAEAYNTLVDAGADPAGTWSSIASSNGTTVSGGLGTSLGAAASAGAIGYEAGNLMEPQGPGASIVGGVVGGGTAAALSSSAIMGTAALGGLTATGVGALVAIPAAALTAALSPSVETTNPNGNNGITVNLMAQGSEMPGDQALWGYEGFTQSSTGSFGASSTKHFTAPTIADPTLAKEWNTSMDQQTSGLTSALNTLGMGTSALDTFSFPMNFDVNATNLQAATANIANAMAEQAVQASNLEDAFNQALEPGEDYIQEVTRIGQAWSSTNLASQAAGTSLATLSGSSNVVGQGDWASQAGELMGGDANVAAAFSTYAQYGRTQPQVMDSTLSAQAGQAGQAIGELGNSGVNLSNFWGQYGQALSGPMDDSSLQQWGTAATQVKGYDDDLHSADQLMQSINNLRISQLREEMQAAQDTKVMVDGLNVSISQAYSTMKSLSDSLLSTVQSIEWNPQLSPNTPTQTFQEQETYYNQLKAQVEGEDTSSVSYTSDVQKLTAFSQTFLQTARQYLGPSQEYYGIEQDVTGTLQKLQTQTQDQVTVLKQQLQAQDQLINSAQAEIDQLSLVNSNLQILGTALDGLGQDISGGLSALGAQMSYSANTGAAIQAANEAEAQTMTSLGIPFLGAFADGTPGVSGPGVFIAGDKHGPELISLSAGQSASVTTNRDFSGVLTASAKANANGQKAICSRLDNLIGVIADLHDTMDRVANRPVRR